MDDLLYFLLLSPLFFSIVIAVAVAEYLWMRIWRREKLDESVCGRLQALIKAKLAERRFREQQHSEEVIRAVQEESELTYHRQQFELEVKKMRETLLRLEGVLPRRRKK